MMLRIILRVIAQSPYKPGLSAAKVDMAAHHVGAVAFIHRYGSSLNAYVLFHV